MAWYESSDRLHALDPNNCHEPSEQNGEGVTNNAVSRKPVVPVSSVRTPEYGQLCSHRTILCQLGPSCKDRMMSASTKSCYGRFCAQFTHESSHRQSGRDNGHGALTRNMSTNVVTEYPQYRGTGATFTHRSCPLHLSKRVRMMPLLITRRMISRGWYLAWLFATASPMPSNLETGTSPEQHALSLPS